LYFFTEIGFRDTKAIRLAAKLKRFGIFTLEQMIGAFCPNIPRLSPIDIKNKGLTVSAHRINERSKPGTIISKLHKVLQLSRSEAKLVYDAFNKVPRLSQSYHFNYKWAFGGKKRHRTAKRNTFWNRSPRIRLSKGVHVIPEYESAGNVFDQGSRGTCVANAACTLLDYKLGLKSSRQFLYHQCKMVDGIPDSEGTFIDVPFKVLEKTNFIDHGCVLESTWSYNPNKGSTKHQGPPPEKAFDCKRILQSDATVAPRSDNLISDIKYLLNYKLDNKACPVVFGVPLYESFFSQSTSKTGWVTMPLPDEIILGYHAMIIVGYDDDRKLFLVRNSWGTNWAAENDKGYKGHAWIPYEYIKKYVFDPTSLEVIKTEHITVSPNDRLYNNMSGRTTRRKAAASPMKRKKQYELIRETNF